MPNIICFDNSPFAAKQIHAALDAERGFARALARLWQYFLFKPDNVIHLAASPTYDSQLLVTMIETYGVTLAGLGFVSWLSHVEAQAFLEWPEYAPTTKFAVRTVMHGTEKMYYPEIIVPLGTESVSQRQHKHFLRYLYDLVCNFRLNPMNSISFSSAKLDPEDGELAMLNELAAKYSRKEHV